MLSIITIMRCIFLCIAFLPSAYSMQNDANLTFAFGIAKAAAGSHGGSSEDRSAVSINAELPLFAVFDGHNGTRAVNYVRNNLPLALYNSCFEDEERPEFADENIDRAFSEIGEKCLQKEFRDSGTTALSVFFDQGRPTLSIIVASIGDSNGVLISDDEFEQLAPSHRKENPRELERIKNHRPLKRKLQDKNTSQGARQLKFPCTATRQRINFNFKHSLLLSEENLDTEMAAIPFRLNLEANLEANKENIPPFELKELTQILKPPAVKKNKQKEPTSWCKNIGVTRCFGHPSFAEKGLIYTPEIRRIPLQRHSGLLVLYTDGVGDILDAEVIANFVAGQVNKGQKLKKIAQQLLLLAAKKSPGRLSPEESDQQLMWRIKDDMTVVIVRFNEPEMNDDQRWTLPLRQKEAHL